MYDGANNLFLHTLNHRLLFLPPFSPLPAYEQKLLRTTPPVKSSSTTSTSHLPLSTPAIYYPTTTPMHAHLSTCGLSTVQPEPTYSSTVLPVDALACLVPLS